MGDTRHGTSQWGSSCLCKPLLVWKYWEREGGAGEKEFLSVEKGKVKYIIFTFLSTMASERADEI